MKRSGAIVLAVGLACLLTACAAGSAESHQALAGGVLSQLVLGFWHGLIAPITLLVEVIRKLAPGIVPWPWRLYELKNTSVAYDVGFYFGLAGGPAAVWSRRRRRV
ncbi:MAG TPA: hypothetical protein VII73_11735 [Caulobacteraceae bacterium]